MDEGQKIKVTNYKYLNQFAQKGQILFTGSSLMEQFPIAEMCTSADVGKVVYNRGIGGFTTDDFLEVIDTVLFDLEPSKVFINIGTNDMKLWEDGRDWRAHLLGNYEKILNMCREKLPHTNFYLMAFYPGNTKMQEKYFWDPKSLAARNNSNITEMNRKVSELAARYSYNYIDVNQGLTDENGDLKEEFTMEGTHIYANGYRVVFQNLLKYI